jgi:hypothetical protein
MLANARAEALFASDLQMSQCPSAAQVKEAVTAAVKRLRTRGCACCVAQEYGDHPDDAAKRMTWCRRQISDVFGGAR